MLEGITFIAAVTPTEALVDLLEDSIKEWKLCPTKEKFEKLAFNSNLILLKKITNGEVEGAFEVTQQMEKIGQYQKMFENKEN
jgi:hypothetical protein